MILNVGDKKSIVDINPIIDKSQMQYNPTMPADNGKPMPMGSRKSQEQMFADIHSGKVAL